jgi:hypothetical protein
MRRLEKPAGRFCDDMLGQGKMSAVMVSLPRVWRARVQELLPKHERKRGGVRPGRCWRGWGRRCRTVGVGCGADVVRLRPRSLPTSGRMSGEWTGAVPARRLSAQSVVGSMATRRGWG